jgi:cysteine desulfurase
MLLDLSGPPANPASVHTEGQHARNLLTQARSTVASFLQAKPDEIIFTSGATEGLNYLLHGLSGHIITTQIEHSSVYRTLQARNLPVTYLPIDLFGAPTPAQVAAAIRPDTTAIILSSANSETGVKIDLPEIAAIAHRHKIPLYIDAVASIGKEPFIRHPGISALVLGAHKFHGPKGVGAVYLSPTLKIPPFLTGGSQESGRRAGTPNLAGILGLAEALKIFKEDELAITEKITDLRNHFELGLMRAIPNIAINGLGPRISNTSNIAFEGINGETLLMQLDLAGIAASHGTTCSSGAFEPSRVLTHMGMDQKTARSSIRFSVSRMNTREEMDIAIERISTIVQKLRSL